MLSRSLRHRVWLTALGLSVTLMPGAALPVRGGPIRFRDVTGPAGLRRPLRGMLGHGGAWGDYTGDGRVDLLVGGFCDRPDERYGQAGAPVPTRLLRQVEGGRFEIDPQRPARIHARTSGALFVDLDNDGDPELYIANNARSRASNGGEPQRTARVTRSRLLRNDGGRFTDITDASGAVPDGLLSARNVVPLDFNADGRLDLLVVEDRFGGHSPRTVLLRNDGDLRFSAVNDEAGLPEDLFGLGCAVADLNGDGVGDLFIPHSNRLLLSTGDGAYREDRAAREALAWQPLDAEDWPCGADFADLNRDGRMDLVISIHHAPARNRVFLNEGPPGGPPRFRDVTERVGLGTAVPAKCPHVEARDFDNDGWLDLYFSAAWSEGGRPIPLIYRNAGTGDDGLPRFRPPRPVEPPMHYYPAGPAADYDRDGRVDLVLINWFAEHRSRLLRNISPARRWLRLRVVGRTINRPGIGAKARVYEPGRLGERAALIGYDEVRTGNGYASGQPPVCHFGLNERRRVDLRVTLPNGRVVERRGVEANQQLTIEEPP